MTLNKTDSKEQIVTIVEYFLCQRELLLSASAHMFELEKS